MSTNRKHLYGALVLEIIGLVFMCINILEGITFNSLSFIFMLMFWLGGIVVHMEYKRRQRLLVSQ